MKSRLDNYRLPAVPPWDEIIERTDRDMAAQNFLNRHGLWLEINTRGWRHRAVYHRGCKSFSVGLASGPRRPTPREALAATVPATRAKDRFAQRVRGFFAPNELRELRELQ